MYRIKIKGRHMAEYGDRRRAMTSEAEFTCPTSNLAKELAAEINLVEQTGHGGQVVSITVTEYEEPF